MILHVGPTRTRTTKSRSRYRPSFTPTARHTHGQEPGGWCHHQHVLQPARRAQELGVRDGEDHDHRDDPTDGHRLRRAKDLGERSVPRANRTCTSATRSRTRRRTPSPRSCTRSAATAARRTSATLAGGESVIKCPCPLNVLKDTYDHSFYSAHLDKYQHLITDSPQRLGHMVRFFATAEAGFVTGQA